MAYSYDQSSDSAIDTSDEAAPPPAPGSDTPDDGLSQPGALPDVGEPPVAAHDASISAQQGISELGNEAAASMGRGVENVKKNPIVKTIAAYLMGADASHPHMVQQAARQAPGATPSDRNVNAVAQAAQTDKEKAWQLMQANRVAYNAKQAFAMVAINGTPQKAPDLNAAIHAANQAAEHVLDGSNVQFVPSQTGVTATVKGADGRTQNFNLSPDQFKQYLNVGKEGMWDRQMEPGGIAANLTKVTQGAPAGAQGAPAQQQPQGDPSQGVTSQSQRFPGVSTTQPAKAAPEKEPFRMQSPGEETYDDELQKRAWGMFPGAGSSKERAEWMAAQEEKGSERQNKLDIEERRGTFKVQGADVTGQHHENAADITGKHRENSAKLYSDAKSKAALAALQGHIQAQEAAGIRNQRTLQEKALASIVITGGKMSPQQKAVWDEITTKMPTQAAPQQRPAAPQQQTAPGATPGGQQSTNPQDQQALAWANANPGDPRATQIKQRLGAQ